MRGRSSRTRPARPRGAREWAASRSGQRRRFAQTADNVVLLGSDDLAALLSSLDDDLLVQGLDGVDVDDPGVDTLGSQLLGSMRASLTISRSAMMAISLPSVSCSPLPSSKW